MRFIPASERLPKNDVSVVIKEYSGILDIGWYSEGDDQFHTDSDLGPLSKHQVYWLDESEPPPPADIVAEAERLYAYGQGKNIGLPFVTVNGIADVQRAAHISCAEKYRAINLEMGELLMTKDGEIESLKNDVAEQQMRIAELEGEVGRLKTKIANCKEFIT